MLKKVFLFSILLNLLFSTQYLYAAPIYGTHMPRKHRWIWGLEANFLVDRNLDNDEGGTNGNRYFLSGSYGIFSWLCLDGKIGVGDVDWDRTKSNKGLSYSTSFAGGYGFRIKGYEYKPLGIRSVVGFQHISVHPQAKNQDGNKNETIIDEWQASIVISKDINRFVPYLGARYGTVDLIKWTNEIDRERIKAEKNYGVIVGLDYWLRERMKLNFEAAFLDGEEIAIGISYDF